MGKPSYYRKYLSTKWTVILIGVFISLVDIQISKYAEASAPTNSKTVPKEKYYGSRNITADVFEARDLGSTYSAPPVGGSSSSGGYSSMDAGGGYGAPVMASPQTYKYQIYPNPPMQMQSMGWGGGGGGGGGWGSDDEDGDDGGDGGFPKELIGLLGLKGLKGLKGYKGVFALLKVLLLLKKALGIPLFPLILPFILPLILPFLLLGLGKLILPLLLLLFFPVLVFNG